MFWEVYREKNSTTMFLSDKNTWMCLDTAYFAENLKMKIEN